MLKLHNISLQRGQKFLFEEANLSIFAGQKIGLVGANGCGKSSLFALLRGEIGLDSGDCDIPKKLVIANVAQETPALDMPAVQYVIDGDKQLRAIEKQLAIAEEKNDAQAMAHAHEQLAMIDGYSAYARAAQLLHGLSFQAKQIDNKVSEFSGGWRMRLNLAQALMCRSDILLLDEPTNHLDLDAIIWLEKWLARYTGTLLLISHDRDFLDNLCDRIVHVEHQQLNSYTGNYSYFEKTRAEKLAQQQSAHIKQQKEIDHMQSFVDRFRAKASKARQAQSRLNALNKMTVIAAAHVDSPFNFSFKTPKVVPNPLLNLNAVDLGYDDNRVLKNIKFIVSANARIGLLGPNGAGKSTLIKCLAQLLPPMAGEMQRSDKLIVGYFAQHQVDYLNLDETPLQHLKHLAGNQPEKVLRAFLGQFNFSQEMALSTIENFSGGEKARLALALIIWRQPNLLLLDEPTNHLDLDMRHALNQALQNYQGTLILVSHDRHLLRSTCDELLLVAEEAVQPFDGDLDDYQQWLKTFRRDQLAGTSTKKSTVNKKQQRQQTAETRKLQQSLQKKIKTFEKKLDTIQRELGKIEGKLADENLYDSSQKDTLTDYLKQQGQWQKKQETTEIEWLEAQEELEHFIKQQTIE